MITRSRSLVLAITPQLGHPAALRIVSMPTSSSSPSSVTASTRNPRSPNKASSNSVPSPIVRGPPVLSVVEQPREWRGPWPRRWIPIGARLVVHAPQFIEKSPFVGLGVAGRLEAKRVGIFGADPREVAVTGLDREADRKSVV